jgi:hypothetical protein
MIASMLLSSVEAYPTHRRKIEKSSRLMLSLKRKDKPHLQPQISNTHSEVINMIRVQMQISSKMDTCIRRNLVQLATLRTGEQIDLPQLALGLLVGIFKSDFPNEKLYMKWKTRQVITNYSAIFSCRPYETSLSHFLDFMVCRRSYDNIMQVWMRKRYD